MDNIRIIAETARDFAEKNIRPHIMEWDEAQTFPVELFKELGQMGFMGIIVPEEYGGSGLGYNEYVAIVDEISQVDPSIGLSVAAHNSLCTNHIFEFGNEEQKRKWLPQLASGKSIGAWGLTEHNSGSDSGSMNTTAVRDGEDWVINGAKNFITHAISGDIAVVMTRTGEKGTRNNATAFVLEKGMPGFSSGKKENKLGMRASETAELIFDNVRVPDSHRLGAVGEGFKQAMKILDGGRISIAALSLGIAKGAYKAALKYSKEREQFGQPINKFQAVNFMLADMATEIDASELLIYRAAEMKMANKVMTKEGAMAKYYASEACVRIANNAVQIFGGYGYSKEFPVEKFYRDSKLCTIGEGTSEIQKLVIGREISR
ncbi:acyl-CoA dehydrogenase family protein [Bergeyella cardium]|uniref:Cyclohex-1-ene-1-carbonyl-CoA dehydrogenase n=1 Tax=Bergeyella cardium TaxID=1585976 RepID=A0A6P1QVS4_9FLAO|nr:acyl-CoA dehydrogenase family protein [Bergeyella cardium]QHN65909.1 acyl-CoA dehydrogenase [Bergeyella cardium]WHE33513.1 acyl-CoA dehydrogenase family protein [Bergeyella cardium]WHF60163.1 acyl-CoA dehydrogenase family protein [Bergeyella cardium]